MRAIQDGSILTGEQISALLLNRYGEKIYLTDGQELIRKIRLKMEASPSRSLKELVS